MEEPKLVAKLEQISSRTFPNINSAYHQKTSLNDVDQRESQSGWTLSGRKKIGIVIFPNLLKLPSAIIQKAAFIPRLATNFNFFSLFFV